MSAIEQRARELLAAEHRKLGRDAEAALIAAGDVTVMGAIAIEAIIAALTPPEGFVLVPVDLLRLVAGCAYPVSTELDSRGHAWSEAYLDQVLPVVKAALSSACPEVKP